MSAPVFTFDQKLDQIQVGSRLYDLTGDPMLKSAIALLGSSLADAPQVETHPQIRVAYEMITRMATAGALLYGETDLLPDDLEEDWSV